MTKDKCLVCGNTSFEVLDFFYSRFLPFFFHEVGICKSCGHIQIYKMFNKEKSNHINKQFFNSVFLQKNKVNVKGNLKKEEKMEERLSPFIHEKMNILDVGAGEGWTLEYFQRKECNYFAIEAIPRLANSILERGGQIIGENVFDNYENYKSYFDIIIFRHIIEHLHDPTGALKNLKFLLKRNGLIYLALPNAEDPEKNMGLRRGFKTSFLRPIHLSYFHPENITRVAINACLEPKLVDLSGEIFMLLQHCDKKQMEHPNLFEQQKATFQRAGKKYLLSDLIIMIFDFPKALFKRFITYISNLKTNRN